MGHAEHDFLQAQLAAALHDLFERRHHRLATVQAEALGAGVFEVQEAFELLGRHQPVVDRPPAALGELGAVVDLLDPLLQPGLLLGVLDVLELDPDIAAIGLAQARDDLLQRGRAHPQAVDIDPPVPIGFGEAVEGRIEFRMPGRLVDAERIEIRLEMAAHPVGADQPLGGD